MERPKEQNKNHSMLRIVYHARRLLVTIGHHSMRTSIDLFLILSKYTAGTKGRCTVISTATPIDAETLSDLGSLHHEGDPMAADPRHAKINGTLWSRHSNKTGRVSFNVNLIGSMDSGLGTYTTIAIGPIPQSRILQLRVGFAVQAAWPPESTAACRFFVRI